MSRRFRPPVVISSRCQSAVFSAVVVLIAVFAAASAPADEREARSATDRWAKHPALQQFDLAGKELPARLFLVRTRGELPASEGITVHGSNGGVFLVSGDAEALDGLTEFGCAVIPLREVLPVRESTPREWIWIERPDPAIAEMVSQVEWEGVLDKIQQLVDFGTRYSYADNHPEVAESIAETLAGYGMEPALLPFPGVFKTLWNVEAVQTGTVTPDSCVIICGHFDSISRRKPLLSAPGADDNATGTAAVLTAAQILSQYEFEYTIRYLCFAGEEQGLLGSKDFARWARAHKLGIVGVLNFDMLGYWEPGAPKDLEIETNNASQWLGAAVLNAADLYTDTPYRLHVYDGAWWSDHASFWQMGFAAVNHEEAWDWGDPDFNPHYHTTRDLPLYLDPGFTVDNVKVAIAALATLARPVRPLAVAFDVRPGSCVNPFNPKSNGVVPALIVGSADLDVRDIDLASLRVARTVVPTKVRVVDLASASDAPCADMSSDGIADLAMKLPAAEIAAAMGAKKKRERVTLRLTGTLADGTRIEGEDMVAIVGNLGGPQRTEENPALVTGLSAAVPNPFNPTTRIRFTLARENLVTLFVYDAFGRRVARLLEGVYPAGEHTVTWDAAGLPSGVYFYRLWTNDYAETRKLVLLK